MATRPAAGWPFRNAAAAAGTMRVSGGLGSLRPLCRPIAASLPITFLMTQLDAVRCNAEAEAAAAAVAEKDDNLPAGITFLNSGRSSSQTTAGRNGGLIRMVDRRVAAAFHRHGHALASLILKAPSYDPFFLGPLDGGQGPTPLALAVIYELPAVADALLAVMGVPPLATEAAEDFSYNCSVAERHPLSAGRSKAVSSVPRARVLSRATGVRCSTPAPTPLFVPR